MSLNILMYNVKHHNVFHYIAVPQCILILLTRLWKCSQFLAITTGYLYNKTRGTWKVDVLNSRDSETHTRLFAESSAAVLPGSLSSIGSRLVSSLVPSLLAILVPTRFQSILTVQLAKVSFWCLKLKHFTDIQDTILFHNILLLRHKWYTTNQPHNWPCPRKQSVKLDSCSAKHKGPQTENIFIPVKNLLWKSSCTYKPGMPQLN